MTQSQALDILKTGANVFLTGEPGAGKTYVVNQYVSYLRSHGVEPSITASTGIAATHIHGSTIHSWSGIGIKKILSAVDLDHIATTEYLVRQIRRATVLIIDEVSMLDALTLDAVDQVCKEVRNSTESFGGMQVVLVGDFFQLPPVTRGTEKAAFAFGSKAWSEMKPVICYLTEQHRQADAPFLALLSAIRAGSWDGEHISLLEARLIGEDSADALDADLPRLFAHNADVDSINTMALDAVDGAVNIYTMYEKGAPALVASLKKGCLSPERLTLKVGAIVMCTKNNIQKGFVNGTLGVVVRYESGSKYPIIRTHAGDEITIEPMDWSIEDGGKVKAQITQVPLRLAWAITIHKSQGMSLDAAMMDLRQVFEYGQGYVALSRVRALSGLHLAGWNEQTFKVHPEVLAADVTLREESDVAAIAFSKLEQPVLRKMHERFILASGGTIVAQTGEKKKAVKQTTTDKTRELIKAGKSIVDVVKERKIAFVTVVGHLEQLAKEGAIVWDDIATNYTSDLLAALPEIHAVMADTDSEFLTPVKEKLGDKYSFDAIRLARIALLLKNN